MASGPITSWQIVAETMETVTDFIFLGTRISADGDCSHKIKKTLAPWKKSHDQPRQHIKKQRHYIVNSALQGNKLQGLRVCLRSLVHLVKAMVFPVAIYGRETWTIKKASKELKLLNCGVGESS